MRTSSAKAKGRRAAQEAKEIILKHLRTLEQGDVVVTSSGTTGEDLQLSPSARKIFPFQIEAKNVEKINIWKAIEQAKTHGPHKPLVLFKRNHEQLQVALDFDLFMNIYAMARVVINKYEELAREGKK
jgi:hypothetical protein